MMEKTIANVQCLVNQKDFLEVWVDIEGDVVFEVNQSGDYYQSYMNREQAIELAKLILSELGEDVPATVGCEFKYDVTPVVSEMVIDALIKGAESLIDVAVELKELGDNN